MDRRSKQTPGISPPPGLPTALLMHGLWQPVSTLHALALALTRGWSSLDDQERLRMANDIESETVRLRELAEDLTTLSLIHGDGYRPALRRESVVDLLRDAAASVGELDGRLRVRVEPNAVGGTVMGDRGRLLRVLKAFLQRADRGSDEETEVTLRAGRDVAGDAGGMTFTVEYRGEDPALVDSFDLVPERPAAGARGSGRARLSMYVSRCLVEAHGGRIEARSRGGTTTLAFVLPVAESEAA